ncbi:MAG: hypothetical protein IJ642_08340 [Oscillospiraceae bacterium]|nr:hypothetical protein [Oscillospiraceae bacterium]
MSKFESMSDAYLIKTYVPDIYQKNIYAIDYQKLKKAGIQVLTFDIDDTVAALEDWKPPKSAVTLFENLKLMGFEIYLLSNTKFDSRAERFGQRLGVEYIAHAHKPRITGLEEVQNRYLQKHGAPLLKAQMAHIGNSIISDVGSGNTFGIITGLVRNEGNLIKFSKLIITEGKELRHELKKRDIWRKHHKYQHHDQYYQLGEVPPYKK